MGFLEFFVRRPVFASVVSLIVLLIGVVSLLQLSVREYPNIDVPVVSVTTDYPGASAQIIESQVTQILAASIAGIEASRSRRRSPRPGTAPSPAPSLVRPDPHLPPTAPRPRETGRRPWRDTGA